jgi:hypothetical protein
MNTFAGVYNLPGPISTVETAVAQFNSTTTRVLVAPPQDIATGVLDGHPFLVKGLALAIGTGAGNFTFNIYWNKGVNTNLTTFTSDILLIGSGTFAVGSKPAVALLEEMVMWDSNTQQVVGIQTRTYINKVATPTVPVVTPALGTNPLVAAGTVTNVSALAFFATITCSANISSTTLLELSLERY